MRWGYLRHLLVDCQHVILAHIRSTGLPHTGVDKVGAHGEHELLPPRGSSVDSSQRLSTQPGVEQQREHGPRMLVRFERGAPPQRPALSRRSRRVGEDRILPREPRGVVGRAQQRDNRVTDEDGYGAAEGGAVEEEDGWGGVGGGLVDREVERVEGERPVGEVTEVTCAR